MTNLPRTSLAAVTVGKRQIELRELDIPQPGPDEGLLFVEAAGVCGSDVKSFNSDRPPRVMGHENVGYIAAIGREAQRRWGVSEGDRVALEEYLPCGHCSFCRSAEFRLCLGSDAWASSTPLRYGTTPVSRPPALWGGFSQYLYLHPDSVLHRVAPRTPATQASLALPLGNGYQWAYLAGGCGPGKSVVIMGPGQQGLGCVLAAKEAGAGPIIVTGLHGDSERLEVAKLLGAHLTLYADDGEISAQVAEATGGAMADIVVDTAAGSDATFSTALAVLAKAGTLVTASAPAAPLREFDLSRVIKKHLTLKGVRGHSYQAVEWALQVIASGRYPLAAMCSLECPLSEVATAIDGTAGKLDTGVIHAAVLPNGA
jgi:threonine dehydrogenase-like Zn-dependent dehydrogenase